MSFRHTCRRAADLTGLVLVTGLVTLTVAQDPSTAVIPAPGVGLVNEVDATPGLQCSATGFGDGRTPTKALVRRFSGETAVVSFDEGWRIYRTGGLSRLVAVCVAG